LKRAALEKFRLGPEECRTGAEKRGPEKCGAEAKERAAPREPPSADWNKVTLAATAIPKVQIFLIRMRPPALNEFYQSAPAIESKKSPSLCERRVHPLPPA